MISCRARARCCLALLTVACGSRAAAVPDFDAVRASYPVSEGVLLDRHGEVIHELRVDDRRRALRLDAAR